MNLPVVVLFFPQTVNVELVLVSAFLSLTQINFSQINVVLGCDFNIFIASVDYVDILSEFLYHSGIVCEVFSFKLLVGF